MSFYPEIFKYRRPVLQYQSGTQVNVQDQIVTGTAGDCTALFSDGKLLTVNSSLQTHFLITQNAILSGGSKQGGLRTGSAVNNTWYALYAVRATDNDNTWCTVGDTVFPVNSSISALNTNFGMNKWMYLGLIRYGDQSTVANQIVQFTQSGNQTVFGNRCVGSTFAALGILLADTSGATTLTYSYSSGSSGTQIAPNISLVSWTGLTNTTNGLLITNSANTIRYLDMGSTSGQGAVWISPYLSASAGLLVQSTAGSNQYSILLTGFIDDALGVGSNPLV